jgi:hypothetical protein
LDRRLGGTHSRYGRCGEEKNLLPGSNPRLSRPQHIAIPTELSRLLIIIIIIIIITIILVTKKRHDRAEGGEECPFPRNGIKFISVTVRL